MPFTDILTPRDVPFEIRFALGQMDKATVKAWAGKDRLKREAALERIADAVAVRFAPLQVAREPGSDGPLFTRCLKGEPLPDLRR